MSKILFTGLTILILLLLQVGCQSKKTIPPSQTTVDQLLLPASSDTSTPDSTSIPPTASPTDKPIQTATETNIVMTTPTVVINTPTKSPTNSPNTAALTETQPVDDCLNEAAFYADVTIPDDTLLEANAAFIKTWQVRNTGTCTWGEGYSLVFAKGDVMDGPLSNPIPVVAPGEIAEVSVNLVAPNRGGQQTGYWEFENLRGSRFGVGSGGHDYIWVQIQVDWSSSGDAQQPTAEPGESLGETGECSATEDPSYEDQILSLINAARQAAGISALSPSSQLSAAAREHSRDMACVDFVDHTGSDGSTWYDRVAAQGYANYSSARENIYVGDPSFGGTPDGAYTWWMNSQVHRDNILNSTVTDIGIGYVFYFNSTYGGYYTVVFARP